ncbi:hypothetical protein TCAL_04058 [Tigriopus californicus]|uniref:inositol-3-phosphate synthase n=1 Tax=Tigriopus californicus TaxID=6832 RepID=A0A553PF06_TIGCA|nr:inositol-3-phosphate synthase 1-A-like [Tigriopus californicus]TRY76256.1 hypothetical protein TCAL_04058 [Tigriopus californicus]|eukprot:TCALIF_04058-PA protein Name:"Similar to isyna1-a Inositol-3-phosphate synthase 1-A (Xenopus laevis)" AED:0.11 eAED:0.11 QI:199/1/1/1/0.83/0.71/7/58/529
MPKVEVHSHNVQYSKDAVEANISYETTEVRTLNGVHKVYPRSTEFTFRTETHVPKLGVMLVGWGGNNGSTLTATCLANSLGTTWNTKHGQKSSNYFGSLTQASTVLLGSSPQGEVYVPMKDMLPMVAPNDIIFDGWDISSLNIAQAMERAKVLDYDLQRQLRSRLETMKPRASIYNKDFIAANQEDRADNTISGSKYEQLEQIRQDIQDFKRTSKVDKVVVLWTANTERFCQVQSGVNVTADELLDSIKQNHNEISPSTLFAVASILEGCPYINGSPQNTFVPGCLELAEKHQVFIGGDDFKSGQTKFKSVMVDFLVNAGLKPVSIASYNHLGNNDGKNLSAPQQFKSKEISKSNVVDDMVQSNQILYADGEKPDHCVVIKYVPYVGDSKRAMDEYTSEIMMGGLNTIAVHNTCEDSLLASPLILDLVILTELFQRITFKVADSPFQPFHHVLSVLGYLCKAPLVPSGAPLINALFRQRSCIENILRACLGLAPLNNMGLEHKLSDGSAWKKAQIKTESGLMNGFTILD